MVIWNPSPGRADVRFWPEADIVRFVIYRSVVQLEITRSNHSLVMCGRKPPSGINERHAWSFVANRVGLRDMGGVRVGQSYLGVLGNP